MAGKAEPHGNLYWLFSLLPASAFLWLFVRIPDVAQQNFPSLNINWVPDLNATLSFRLDGLSMLMSLLVEMVGVLISYGDVIEKMIVVIEVTKNTVVCTFE